MTTFTVHTEESACKYAWSRYTLHDKLWDEWDFRHPFHTHAYHYYFIEGFVKGNSIGLLPLVHDAESETYTYFGDTFPEHNRIFLTKRRYLMDFLNACPEGTVIYNLDPSLGRCYYLEKGDKRYYLDLAQFNHTYDNYLSSFTKKHRKNLRYDLKKVGSLDPRLAENRLDDFETLIKLNKAGFGKDSDYHDPLFVESMRNVLAYAHKHNLLDLISYTIANQVVAVGLGVIYNNVYYVLGSGRDKTIPNIGKLLIATHIQRAMEKKCAQIDFLGSDANWKELWNLQSEQLYDYCC